MARWVVVVGLGLGTLSTSARAGDDGLTFFEKKIRPVLVEHCQACHSAEAEATKKLKGGLRVDTRLGLLEGGDSGPTVVPGKPEESLLLNALGYDDATQMPPKGKLPDAVIADFRAWVAMGAPDPRVESPTSTSGPKADLVERGRLHWAYRPLRRPEAPDVADNGWVADDIDRYILAGLQAKGLRPVTEADRPTLVRRLSFDLHGIAPTPEMVDAFVADGSATAYDDLVDRLLASPRFGERWGRHWLDVARFAESLTLRGFVLTEAWRYRDYVIDTFNNNRSFDQFLREQVAGDLEPGGSLEERRRRLIATSFLALGNTNLEEQDKEQLVMDVVDEQIDTIGKAILGQTIGCARCHDHKFDPIPTKDYYALAGIFRNVKTLEHANVSKWMERPLPVEPDREALLTRHEDAVLALEGRIKQERALLAKAGKAAAVGVLAVQSVPGVVVDDARAVRVGEWKHSKFSARYVGEGYLHDIDAGKGQKSLTFQPEIPRAGTYEVRLYYTPGDNRSTAVPVTILSADGETMVSVNMREEPPVEGRFAALGRFRFEANGQGYALVSNEGTTGHVIADAVAFVPAEQADARVETVAKPGTATATTANGSMVKDLEEQLKQLKASGPRRERALSVFEEKTIGETKVHVRGSVHNLGEAAPRGFLRVVPRTEPPAMPRDQSGRRELAAWLTDPANPLTARVFVNRAWHWLFGAGLVRTTDNFGTTGEAPSHPELLDDLASRFIAEGWSVKGLVRRIVLSRTYRLATAEETSARVVDPENRLCWRHERRRLDAESLRDTLLSVSGRLDERMSGPSFPADLAADYGYKTVGERRSVYEPVFRNALPEIFEVFDFADPSMVVGSRNDSTVAPQALFLLNHPFVREQARAAAERLLTERHDDANRLDRAYRLALGRLPSADERRIGLEFVATGTERWGALLHALFASIEFRYED